jgi:hypothetical protein
MGMEVFMNRSVSLFVSGGLALGFSLSGITSAQASVVDQYASTVIGYSSQWSTNTWSAAQALGTPNTFGYGDINTAWAPSLVNGTSEFLTVGFTMPVYATDATIRETDGNGFVTQVDVLDTNNVLHNVWASTDTSQPGTPVDFLVSWSETSYLVKGLKVYVNTNHSQTWEEIDSIRLGGNTVAPVPIPAAAWLFGSGVCALYGAFRRPRRAAQTA